MSNEFSKDLEEEKIYEEKVTMADILSLLASDGILLMISYNGNAAIKAICLKSMKSKFKSFHETGTKIHYFWLDKSLKFQKIKLAVKWLKYDGTIAEREEPLQIGRHEILEYRIDGGTFQSGEVNNILHELTPLIG